MSETEIARVGVRLGATSGGSRPDPYGTAEIRQLFPTMMKDKAASIHIPRHPRARLGLAIGLVLALMEGFYAEPMSHRTDTGQDAVLL